MSKGQPFWVQDDFNQTKRHIGKKGEAKPALSADDLLAYDKSTNEEFWFPPWGKYLAWFLSVAVIVSSSVILALYGATFGVVKSKIWLITVLASMAFTTFLVQPVKAVVMSMALSYFFKTERKSVHNRLTAEILRNPYDEIKAAEVAKLRLKLADCYIPRNLNQMKTRKAEIFYRIQINTLIFDVTRYALFLIVICLLATSYKSGTSYFSTETAKRLVVTAKYTDSIPYMRIKTLEQFYEYLNETLVPALMKNESLGYKPNQMINATRAARNETAMQDRGYTIEPNVKLLGQPLLRQLRVQTQSCIVHPSAIPTRQGDCLGELGFSNMDTGSYTLGWKKYKPGDPKPPDLEWYPWQYHSNIVGRVGRQVTASDGGYQIELGRTLNNAHQTLDFIQYFNWIDCQTRVIYIDFGLFAVGTGLFNVITLVLDVSASGVFIPSYSISTVRFLSPHWSDFILYSLLIAVFFILFLIFAVCEFRKMQRIPAKIYFASAWSLLNLLILVLGIAKIIGAILEILHLQSLVKELEAAANKDFVNLRGIAFWDYFSNYVDSFLILATSISMLNLTAFNKVFYYWETFIKEAWKIFFGLYFFLILTLLNFAIFFSVYLGKFQEEFNYVWGSMTSLPYYGVRKHDGMDPGFLIDDLSTSFFYSMFLISFGFLVLALFAITAVCVEDIANQPVRNASHLKRELKALISGRDEPLVVKKSAPPVWKRKASFGVVQVDEIRLQGMKRVALEMLTGENCLEKIGLAIALITIYGNPESSGTVNYNIATIGDQRFVITEQKLKEMKKIADDVVYETTQLG